MNFTNALDALRDGNRVKRISWAYPVRAMIELEEFLGILNFYMLGAYGYDMETPVGYGLTYTDVIAIDWEIVE